MKNTNELKLIDGQFSPEEAEEILMNIFLSKIHFHENKNFSSEERFGKKDLTALKRIPELQKNMDVISKLIADAKHNNETVKIIAEVKINFSKP
jgi:hypothetical protein